MNNQPDLRDIASHFQIDGEFRSAQPYGSGHINDTYRVIFLDAKGETFMILQRINPNIFKQPIALMENIQRVTSHLADRLSDTVDRNRRVLTLIPAWDGLAYHVDTCGSYWRAYRFIKDAHTVDTVESPQQAFAAAKAFGLFQRMLVDLPSPALHETIPGFHNTPGRYAAFEKVLGNDVAGRVALARPEIEFTLSRKFITTVLVGADLPLRVTHNDTKLSNVMLDDSTGEGICVIDLDTVMPGLVLYDFGDMVRTTTSPASEDERDLSKVTMQFPMFEALLRGYLSTAGEFLTEEETSYLAFSCKLITFEQGVRFLTDYLAGDPYYKINHPHHNLDRCRTQFKLVQSIEEQEPAMERLIASLAT